MADRLDVDVCVLGDEPGGLAVAAICALAGAPVALVRKPGRRPSPSSDIAAFVAASKGEVPGLGPTPSYAAAIGHVRAVRERLWRDRSPARFRAMGMPVFEGEPNFLSARSIDVGGTTIGARRFVLAMGSVAAPPSIAGLDAVASLTLDTAFDGDAPPGHLAILGGTPAGAALAQAFRRFGAMVTLFEPATLLAGFDADAVRAVRQRFAADGIVLHEGTDLVSIDRDAEGLRLNVRQKGETDMLRATHLLVATGRRADIGGLALDKAGIAASPSAVGVDGSLRTSNGRVLALGATVDPAAEDQVSAWHGSLVAQNCLLRRPIRLDGQAIARHGLTAPEIAAVGLGETQARAADPACRVLRYPFSENDRAIATGRTEGHVKLIASSKGLILGALIVGPGAGDLIAPFALAIASKRPAGDLAAMILPYPTLSEVGKRAAGTYLQASLSNPWFSRIVRLLRRFG